MNRTPSTAEIRRGRATALQILGLKAGCTELELKRAYRKMAMVTHPDKGGDEKAFVLVNEANQFLLNWGTKQPKASKPFIPESAFNQWCQQAAQRS